MLPSALLMQPCPVLSCPCAPSHVIMSLSTIFNKLRTTATRLKEEVILPSRIPEYRQLLESALAQGYQVIDNAQWLAIVLGEQPAPAKILVMRHDIDTDPEMALLWHEVEHSLGCRASYYFRLRTATPEIVSHLAQAGVHVSYHFEELADTVKDLGLRTPEEARAALPEARKRFASNLEAMRKQFGLPMDIVCSHGDWMNRYLKMTNCVLLEDEALRARLGIRCECYDRPVMDAFSAYTSDSNSPKRWTKGNPHQFIAEGISPMGILTHPKVWRAHIPSNFREVSHRVKEALIFKLHLKPRSR